MRLVGAHRNIPFRAARREVTPLYIATMAADDPPHSRTPLIWRAFARAVASVHIAYVVFVVTGSLLVLRWPSLVWIHLLAVVWAIATMSFDLGCPLTPWEKTFWRKGDRVPYEEGFLQHHVLRTRFPPEKSRRYHIAIGIGVLVLNSVVYYLILRR